MDVFVRAERRAVAPAPEPQLMQQRQRSFFGSMFGPTNQQVYVVRGNIPEITVYPPGARDGYGLDDRSSGSRIIDIPQSSRRTPSSGNGSAAPGGYCVRLCDGFFFPATSSGDTDGKADYCSSACPGSETVFYSRRGDGSIERAVNSETGQAYAALKTAFSFRTKLNAACTCSGLATRGLAAIPITQDITLKRGDLVVTESGVRMFAGSSRFPYREADFVEAGRYGRLPADVRMKIAQIQADIERRRNIFAKGQVAEAEMFRSRSGRLSTVYPVAQNAPSNTGGSVRDIDVTRLSPYLTPTATR